LQPELQRPHDSGGIIGGIEFWGPVGGWAEVELRDHEIWTY
jgi:hypothetical protein